MVNLAHIRTTFALSNGTHGSPHMHSDLVDEGHQIGRHRTARLMRENQLIARKKRRLKRTMDTGRRGASYKLQWVVTFSLSAFASLNAPPPAQHPANGEQDLRILHPVLAWQNGGGRHDLRPPVLLADLEQHQDLECSSGFIFPPTPFFGAPSLHA